VTNVDPLTARNRGNVDWKIRRRRKRKSGNLWCRTAETEQQTNYCIIMLKHVSFINTHLIGKNVNVDLFYLCYIQVPVIW